MASFIAKNYEYPAKALKEGLEGKIMVAFVVDKKGVIGSVTIDEGLCDACDAEAVRVINAMPKWKPGKLNGRKIAVQVK